MAPHYLLINPRSGGEEPSAGELAAEAGRRGIEAHVLRSGEDAGRLVREAAERGAGALGVAGGDGSLGAVAAASLEHELPFAVVPFGTRNHFARDLGLDREDPLGALAAFEGGERLVDVGRVAGRVFLNNVSLGVYAAAVHDVEHGGGSRLRAFAGGLSALLLGSGPLSVSFDVEGKRSCHRALLLLVANNDYRSHDPTGLGERARLDEGLLYAYVLEPAGRVALARLLALALAGRARESKAWHEWASTEFRLEARPSRLAAAIDGEPTVLAPPLELEILPRALRVLVPLRSGDGGASVEDRS